MERGLLKSFRDYMKEKAEAYYTAPHEKFSAGGDFFTAPELDRAFGYAIADFIAPLIEGFNHPVILELGAGRGLMAKDILSFLKENRPDLFDRLEYRIYELSEPLKETQRKVLGEFPNVRWIDDIEPFEGIAVSNEFFDALPVHVIRGDSELYISDGGEEVWLSIESGEIRDFMERMGYSGLDQRIEVPLDGVRFLLKVAENLRRGYNLVIDYGYTSEEIGKYPEGTVMGYKKHRAVGDIISEEMMDVTAHVNFSALMEYGRDAGLETILFDSQRNFLASNPFFMAEVERLAFEEDPESVERLSRLKTMLISMGDRFKVLLQRKV